LAEDGIDADGIGRPALLEMAHDICHQLSGSNTDMRALITLVSSDVPSIPAVTMQQADLIGMRIYCDGMEYQIN
jgi:hypothetical protein